MGEKSPLLRKPLLNLHFFSSEACLICARGTSIVQAMAMGCLPIVDNSGGVKEYLLQDFGYENACDAARRMCVPL